jgi:esterase/lipase superfamily enzyme
MNEVWLSDGNFGAHVRSYGQWGRPVLAFPAEAGSRIDWETNGMVDALGNLLGDGRIKLYCVDSADASTWSDRSISLEDRARRHDGYEQWLLDAVLPYITDDCGGRGDVMAIGVSMGAFHAANLALRHADRVPNAICLSGNYDPSLWQAWGERGQSAYFHNPIDYVANLDGSHLDWLRSQVYLVLVVGQGAFEEHPTRAQSGSRRLADLLASKAIPHELDLWGYDSGHDWPWWHRQAAHHLSRFS